MIGIHTPKRTTVFYKWLREQGILVSNDTWKNDATDSFEYKGLKIMLPNSSEEWYIFSVYLDRHYGTIDSENRFEFDSVRKLKDWLEEYNPEDLFPTYQLLPLEAQEIINKLHVFSDGTNAFFERYVKKLEKHDLTFEWDLNGYYRNLKFKK
jgi:hypothetical protein